MTERLYYSDSYLRQFQGRVVEAADGGRRVYLDRTAFYPTSGGQPYDTGTLGGVAVREVIDEEDRIAHLLESPLASVEVEGVIDWTRRFDHMQQHTGQHLLSAVFEHLYGMRTLSFHMGAETSTIDIGSAALEPRQVEQIEQRCAEIVAQAAPVTVAFEDAGAASGLRKESQRTGTLRIVSIQGVDRSACGGTHLRSAAEIGPVFIRKLDKVRGNVRVEFVCGGRALRQARADFRVLSEIGQKLAAPFERTPELIASQTERLKVLEKTCQRQATEIAAREGRDLYAATAPDTRGFRHAVQRGPVDDAMRARAQAFAACGKAVFLAMCADPPSVLLAVSPDSGLNAGELVKTAVTARGGRGGGNQVLAQGSVASAGALEDLLTSLSVLA